MALLDYIANRACTEVVLGDSMGPSSPAGLQMLAWGTYGERTPGEVMRART